MFKNGIKYKVPTLYHLCEQIELTNKKIKHILEKGINHNRKYCSLRLTNAVWVY